MLTHTLALPWPEYSVACMLLHVHDLVDVAAGTLNQAMSMVDDLNEALSGVAHAEIGNTAG